MRKLSFVFAANLCLFMFSGLAIAQQAYPNKPIRFIVPYSPGGITTIVTQLVSPFLSRSLGQPVIVDNRPGANTVIGTEAAAKSPPDGYTISLIGDPTHVVVPQLVPTSYDPIRDFAPITSLVSGHFVLLINPSVPANTLQELIAYAKSRPGQLNYASAGNGNTNHLAGELFKMTTGTQIRHIPYKGSAQAITDLVGGQVHMTFNTALPAAAFLKSGKLRAIAISGEKRMYAMPHVPTFSEAGLPGFEVKTTLGVAAPAGTPKDIVSKLSAEFAKIMAFAEVNEKLANQGVETFVTSPEKFASILKAAFSKWQNVIKTANIKIEK